MTQSDQFSADAPTVSPERTGSAEHAEDIKQRADPGSNAAKDPEAWVTGDEPATGAQRSYLQTLAEEASESVPAGLNKAEASKKIDELQERTGRGR